MLLASGLTVAFLIAGVSAYRWLVGDRAREVRATLRFGDRLGAVLIPLQIFAGDMHGLNTLEHQPAKVAAMEANWETGQRAAGALRPAGRGGAREPLEIGVPNRASLILTHNADGVVPGLNDFVAEDGSDCTRRWRRSSGRFRVMVGTGMAMLASAGVRWRCGPPRPARRAASWRPAWRRGLPRLLLWALVAMTFSGWVATLAGWYTPRSAASPGWSPAC